MAMVSTQTGATQQSDALRLPGAEGRRRTMTVVEDVHCCEEEGEVMCIRHHQGLLMIIHDHG